MYVPPRMPNGTSTTIEPEWSAAIGPSTAGSAVGIVPMNALPDQPASSTPSASTATMAGAAW